MSFPAGKHPWIGRKPSVTKGMMKAILKVVKAGGTRRDACHYVGVKPVTLDTLVERYPRYGMMLERAAAHGKMHHLDRINDGENRWQASAWWLERKYRDEWAPAASIPTEKQEEDRQIRVRRVPQPVGTAARLAGAEAADASESN